MGEFAVSSTHKELDRIQSEFTTQDGATGIPHETQISQGLQGAYDLSLLKAEPWRVAGKRACRRALRSAYHPGYALSVNDPGLLGCHSLALSDLLRGASSALCEYTQTHTARHPRQRPSGEPSRVDVPKTGPRGQFRSPICSVWL